MFLKDPTTSQQTNLTHNRRNAVGLFVLVCGVFLSAAFPPVVRSTHEADHRFMVEGYICGPDGKAVSNVDVLAKDTKISYGQVVRTDGDGYYKATFHLHNDNLGDPLLVEVRGEQQNLKVEFDPKDLESERKVQVNFGVGCGDDGPPVWVWWGGGALVTAVGGAIGMRLARSQRRQERGKGNSQKKRKS